MGDGRLEVFFVSSDGGLHYYRQSSANVDNWMPMEAMKTGLNEISAAQNYDGSVELFAVGNDKNLYALRESAPNVDSWNAWYQLQGGNGVSVTAGKYGDGRLGVFFVSSDGGIHYYNQSSPNVDNWTAMEVMTTGLLAITAAQNYDGSIELFGVGNDFAITRRVDMDMCTLDGKRHQMLMPGTPGIEFLAVPLALRPFKTRTHAFTWRTLARLHLQVDTPCFTITTSPHPTSITGKQKNTPTLGYTSKLSVTKQD